jgi:hypothetical protein
MLEGIKLESETKLLKYNVSRIQGGPRWCIFFYGALLFLISVCMCEWVCRFVGSRDSRISALTL